MDYNNIISIIFILYIDLKHDFIVLGKINFYSLVFI